MPITIQQLKDFAAGLGNRQLATPKRGNTFTVEAEPTRISFIPDATGNRLQEGDNHLSRWCATYNQHASLDPNLYLFSRHRCYMIPLIEAFLQNHR